MISMVFLFWFAVLAVSLGQSFNYFIVYVNSRASAIGLYLGQGGIIDGFTPQSILDNSHAGSLRIGDRVVAINDVEISITSPVNDIMALFEQVKPPFALTIIMNANASARWSDLESQQRAAVFEPEKRHHQDAITEEMGIGLNIDAYTGTSKLADPLMVMKDASSVMVYLSDGPLKTHEFSGSTAIFSNALKPGECVSKSLLFAPGNPMACTAVHSNPLFGKDSILAVRRGACSLQSKLLHASHINADGIIIINGDESHFAAQPDETLYSRRDAGMPTSWSSMYAAMVGKSSGDTLLAAYATAKETNSNIQVKICSALTPATVRSGGPKALPVLYKGNVQRRPRTKDDAESGSDEPFVLGVSLLELEAKLEAKHPLENSMHEKLMTQKAERSDAARRQALIAALPDVKLPLGLLIGVSENESSVAEVHRNMKLRYFSTSCVIFRYTTWDSSPTARELPDAGMSTGGGLSDRAQLQLALLPHVGQLHPHLPRRRTEVDPSIAFGLFSPSSVTDECIDNVLVTPSQMDDLLGHLLQVYDGQQDSLIYFVRQLLSTKFEMFSGLEELSTIDHSGEGGDGPRHLRDRGGILHRIKTRIIHAAAKSITSSQLPLSEDGSLFPPAAVGGKHVMSTTYAQAETWLQTGQLHEIASHRCRELIVHLKLMSWLDADTPRRATSILSHHKQSEPHSLSEEL